MRNVKEYLRNTFFFSGLFESQDEILRIDLINMINLSCSLNNYDVFQVFTKIYDLV